MFTFKKWATLTVAVVFGAILLAACGPTTEPTTITEIVEVTREVIVEGEPEIITEQVEVTRVVEVEVEAEEEPEPAKPKDLIVCQAQEPDTLYPWGGSMLAALPMQHGIFENNITGLSFGYQAQGIEKLPSLADGDAVLNVVEVNAGDTVIDVNDDVVTLEEGVTVVNAEGEEVAFSGEPVMMEQLVANFTLKPRIWSDGTPVTAGDSVYSFGLVADPDTPTSKFTVDRTASYEATGELDTRWTGIPGYKDSTYFLNFWQPLPEHAWGGFTAAELLEAEESARLPMGDGPFVIREWVAGDSILMTPNDNYYRKDEGLPRLDSVTFKFIPDTNQLVAQMLSGQCDIGTQDGMDVGQAPFLIEAENNGLLVPYFQTGTVYEHIDFGINSEGDYGDDIGRPDWFEDVRVRQAMVMCTDRQSMVDNIFYGRSEVISSYVPSVHPLYPDGLTEYPYDVDAANALLDEVGFVDTDGDGIREYAGSGTEWDGTPFAPSLGTTSGNEMRQQLTQIFKENMLDCGIDIQLFYLPPSEWFAQGPDGPLFSRRFDLGEFAWLTGVEPSCSLYLSDQIPSADNGWAGQNETGWVNEEFDAACKRALGALPGTVDYEEGHKDAQRIFSREVPIIPLFLRLKVAAARPEVLNFGVDPTENSELWNIGEIDLQQ